MLQGFDQWNEQYDVISSEPLYGNEWPLASWTDVIFYWSPLRNSLFSFSPAVRSERSVSHSCELHPCVQYQAQGHSSRTHARWHVRVSSIGLRTLAEALRPIQNEWRWFTHHKILLLDRLKNRGTLCQKKLENYLPIRLSSRTALSSLHFMYKLFRALRLVRFATADHGCHWEKAVPHWTGCHCSLSQLQKVLSL